MAIRPAIEVPAVPARRPWPRVGLVALVVAALVAAGTVAWWRTRPRADLVMTLAAPPGADLHRAAGLLRDRLSAAGYGHPRVSVRDRQLVAAVAAGADPEGLRQLARPGRLSLRAAVAGPTVPHARAAVPSGPAAVPSDAPVPAAVVARLGPAYQAARGLTDPGEVEPGTLAALAPFGALTPGEVATLPAAMQYAVPTVSCAQLNARPPGDDPGAALVACEHTGALTKYLLDPAAVAAADVAGADVVLEPVPGWTVAVRFTAGGQARWTALTRAAVDISPSNEIAAVVDDEVVSAFTVRAVGTGDATISGTAIDRGAARRLAALLRYGPLPAGFTVASITGGQAATRWENSQVAVSS